MSKQQTCILPLVCLYRKDEPGSIQIDRDVLISMSRQLSRNSQTEQGGFLGANSQGIICDFWYDRNAQRDATGYVPSSACLADAIEAWHQSDGLSFAGIIHTHNSSMPKLSRSDLIYTQRLLEYNSGMERLIMGLSVNGDIKMYLFERDFIPWLNHKLQHNEPLYHSQM